MITRVQQTDLFNLAAPYARRMLETSDPSVRKTLRILRDAWIMLANSSESMTEETFVSEVAKIEVLEAKLGPRIAN